MEENPRVGLFESGVFRQDDFGKVIGKIGGIHLDELRLLEPIGDDVQDIFLFQIGQRFMRAREKIGFVWASQNIFVRKISCQDFIVYLQVIKGIVKALVSQSFLVYLPKSVLFPHHFVAVQVGLDEMFNGRDAMSVQLKMMIQLGKRFMAIFVKIPQRMVQIEENMPVFHLTVCFPKS